MKKRLFPLLLVLTLLLTLCTPFAQAEGRTLYHLGQRPRRRDSLGAGAPDRQRVQRQIRACV